MQLCYKYKTINPTILIIFDEVQNSLTWQERTKRGREGEKRREEKRRKEKKREEKRRKEKKRKRNSFLPTKKFKKNFFFLEGTSTTFRYEAHRNGVWQAYIWWSSRWLLHNNLFHCKMATNVRVRTDKRNQTKQGSCEWVWVIGIRVGWKPEAEANIMRLHLGRPVLTCEPYMLIWTVHPLQGTAYLHSTRNWLIVLCSSVSTSTLIQFTACRNRLD